MTASSEGSAPRINTAARAVGRRASSAEASASEARAAPTGVSRAASGSSRSFVAVSFGAAGGNGSAHTSSPSSVVVQGDPSSTNGTPSSDGCNPPRNTARSTPTSIFYARSASPIHDASTFIHIFSIPDASSASPSRARYVNSCHLNPIPPVLTDTSSTTRPFLSRRAFTDSTPSRRRDARARRSSSTGIASPGDIFSAVSPPPRHTSSVRLSVRDATRRVRRARCARRRR